ncbi:extensin family protein [Lutimaribacter sp. EGI FJ00015]|uniref:Extensin family protein n=1 Tax=Lutimaribacter degradans TaxID=2945989 RepID=A0ACC5ZWG0_9RHOB|nr:extensin family protein [Lutimaribacter sp. EGI FJ00013]MCM2562652.1 extensin family protein [Lutimaribacter sp. EGI FJ00013]MCO0613809.1 extensin family protein [Lutimaribacter sp. EGI FJ00015]MCO0636708.1 extensin family protein [Lutimaribacter sp. EGI FJ00014]
MKGLAAVLVLLLAGAALAEAPDTSLRPVLRTDAADPSQAEPTGNRGRLGLFQSLRPRERSDNVERRARQSRAALRRGAVCGDADLQGDVLGRVTGQMRGCGIDNAVRLKSVSGVRLSSPVTVDCGTAKALKSWVERGMRPAVGNRGGGVDSIRVFASYACRTRNSQKGARISEHGKGRALDIGAFGLRNGAEISVLRDWGKSREGRILRKMHRTACGPFGTVLGPEANRFHRDHFHFDTAGYRSGTFCR